MQKSKLKNWLLLSFKFSYISYLFDYDTEGEYIKPTFSINNMEHQFDHS